jgi:competence protein ComEC
MTWHQIPFVRIVIPFIAGIFFSCFQNELFFISATGLFLISTGIIAFLAFTKKVSWTMSGYFGMLLSINLFLLGNILNYRNEKVAQSALHINFNEAENSFYIAKIISEPILKEKTIQTELELLFYKDSTENYKKASAKILAYFQIDSASVKLCYGDAVQFFTKIKRIGKAENPYGFNPAAYYGNKGIYHQVYISKEKWKTEPGFNDSGFLTKHLIAWRKNLTTVFDYHLNASPNENAVASALVLGARTSFTNELKNAYADTGATHILSVSGLHVGLVATLLSWILSNFKSKKAKLKSNKGESVILILAIWFYALLSGASPSVLRSAVMFSFIIFGRIYQQKISIYNSLAASAFFLLLWQPSLIWDIGFQLSYLALAGIVIFHPFIYKKLYFKNKILDWTWNITAVSIAAQLVTFPLSLFYFHQFPVYFWLSGIVVIPISTVALYVGIALLAFSWLPVLNTVLGFVLWLSLALMNGIIFVIEALPFAVISGYWIEHWEMILLYIVIFTAFVGLLKNQFKYVLTALLLLIVVSANQLLQVIKSGSQESIFVYKVKKSSLIDYTFGHKTITIVDSLAHKNANLLLVNKNNLISKNIRNQKVIELGRENISTENYSISKVGLAKFGKHVLFFPYAGLLADKIEFSEKPEVDFLMIRNNPKIKNIIDLQSFINFKYLVFDASNSDYRLSKWKRECNENSIPFIDCSEEGRDILGVE